MKNRIVPYRWRAVILGMLLALSQFPLALAQELSSEQLVDALANSNAAPSIVEQGKFRKLALFPKDYDWKERDRIKKSIVALEKQLDSSFEVVVGHLDDDRYCYTMYNDNSESASNRSIGDVCDQLLLAAVVAPYMPFVKGDERAYMKMRRPLGQSQRSKGLTEWFQTRAGEGKRLVDLQIEACEWAEKAFENLEGISEKQKAEAIRQTQERLATLRKERTPVAASTITQNETYQIAGESTANRMRKEIEASPQAKVKGEKGGR